jgi:hypothetical protein
MVAISSILAAAGIAAGAVGAKKSGILDAVTGGDVAAPPAPPEAAQPASRVPTVDDKAPGEAAERQRRRQSGQAGRRSTVLTSPLGLTEPASTSRRQLLGR